MRQIKFRGRDNKGKLHYSDYRKRHDGNEYIFDGEKLWQVESVAQFVGYDTNRVEIYEGAELVDVEGKQSTARIADMLQDDNGLFSFLPYPTKLTLK